MLLSTLVLIEATLTSQPYIVDGFNFTQDEANTDSNSQGTHVAGIITQGNTEIVTARVTNFVATIQKKHPDLSAETIAGVFKILGGE